MLIIHPEHPQALAIMDAEGNPQFVDANRVLNLYNALRGRVDELEAEVARLRGHMIVDDAGLLSILCNAI